MRHIYVVAALIGGLSLAGSACADQWLPPKPKQYLSADGQWRLTVTPRAIASPLAYFQDKADGKKDAGAVEGNLQKQAQGFMEHLEQQQWKPVWNEHLVNEVSPVEAVVSNTGSIATFDNWHSMGYGDNVVVIYDEHGHKVRNLALQDFLPRFYVGALPRTVSSLYWGSGHHLSADGKQLLLQVVIPPDPTADYSDEPPEQVEIAVNMADGQVVPPQGPAWDRALRAAKLADAKFRAYVAKEDAEFKAPLSPPGSDAVLPWHQYLAEAFRRSDADWKDGAASTAVLGRKGNPDYQRQLGLLRNALADPVDKNGAIMLGSPDPANLVKVVAAMVAALPENQLSGSRIYIAAPPSLQDAAAKAVARTGASFILLDTGKPIPQRPERLERYLSEHREDESAP